MGNLGNLWFSLNLDTKNLDKGLEEAKKKIEQMGGEFNIDVTPVKAAIKDVENQSAKMQETLKKNLTLSFGVDDLQRKLNINKMLGVDGAEIRKAEKMLTDFRQALLDAGTDSGKLDQLSEKFKRLKIEVGLLTREQRAFNAEQKKADAKVAAQEIERMKDAALGAESSIYRLEAALRELKDAYRQLSASDRDSVIGKDLLNRINQADAALTEINSKMANNASLSRTFGTQYNGLFVQTQQLIRELPSATISFQQFMLAISNNLPMFADELARANQKVKEMKAAGEAAVPVWQQLAKALFSWQTALMLAVVAATAFGDEISAWIKDLFKSEKAFDSSAEAAKNFADAMRQGAKDAQDELAMLKKLYSAATDTAESMEERTAAIREIKELYPDYFKDLSDEVVLADEARAAYDQLSASILASAKARAALDKITENSRKSLDLEEDVTAKQAEIEKLLIEYEKLQAKIKAVEQTTSDPAALKGNVLLSSLRQSAAEISAQVQGIEGDISQRQAEIQSLAQANERLSNSIKVSDLVSGGFEDDSEDFSSGDYTSIYEQQKVLKDVENTINEAIKQMRLNLHSNSIKLMEEGNEKELAQINLDYDLKVAAIKKRERELLEVMQEAEFKRWQMQNPDYKEKNLQFTPTIKELPEVNAADFALEYQQAIEERQQKADALLNSILAKYQDYNDKRLAIEQKFNDDIELLEKSRTKSNAMVVNKAVLLAQKELREALQELDDEQAAEASKDSGFIKMLFGDVSSLSFDALSKFIAQARQLRDYLDGKGDKGGITFISAEQLEAISRSPEEVEKLRKGLDKLLSVSGKGNEWTQIFDMFKTGFASLQSAKGFEEVSGAIGTITGAAAKAAYSLSDMFDKMDNQALADAVQALGEVMDAVSNIAQGFAQGGIVGGVAAIIGEAIDLIGKMASAAAEHHKNLQQIMFQTIQQQRELNLLLLEQNLLYEKSSMIFGQDIYAKAANAAANMIESQKELQKALTETTGLKDDTRTWAEAFGMYDELLSEQIKNLKRQFAGLAEIEIVVGSSKSGLFGWGGTKDVYKSILDVYPELIDEAGKFNKELAQTILSTRQMTDEDKAALQNLIDLSEQVEAAFDELKDHLTNIFGDLGNSMIDAMVSAFDNGTDAASNFIESISDMLANLAKQMVYSVTLSPIFEQAQNKMMEVAKKAGLDDESKFDAYSEIMEDLLEDALAEQDNAAKLWEKYKEMAASKGFDISSEKDSSSGGLSAGIKGITEDTANLLASYANSMRGDLSVIRAIMEKGYGGSIGGGIDYSSQLNSINSALYTISNEQPKISYLAEAQLNSLNQIVGNTSRNAVAAERISVASSEIKDLLNRVVDKGSNKVRV